MMSVTLIPSVGVYLEFSVALLYVFNAEEELDFNLRQSIMGCFNSFELTPCNALSLFPSNCSILFLNILVRSIVNQGTNKTNCK